jgi:hypothetical protein
MTNPHQSARAQCGISIDNRSQLIRNRPT